MTTTRITTIYLRSHGLFLDQVEAWMSTNIELFYKSVGRMSMEEPDSYDPVKNLRELHRAYPDSCVYLSMISFDQDWQTLLPGLASG